MFLCSLYACCSNLGPIGGPTAFSSMLPGQVSGVHVSPVCIVLMVPPA